MQRKLAFSRNSWKPFMVDEEGAGDCAGCPSTPSTDAEETRLENLEERVDMMAWRGRVWRMPWTRQTTYIEPRRRVRGRGKGPW